jgi:hypothetical protein
MAAGMERLVASALRMGTIKPRESLMPVSSDPAAVLEAAGYRRDVAGRDFDALVAACATARATGAGLLLSGMTGCGKSLAMRALAPRSVGCRWIDCTNGVQVAWLDDRDIFDGQRGVVLDDLGAEPVENNYGVQRYPVANFIHRLMSLVENGARAPRLYVTTNLTSTEISDRYGDRMLSRLLALVVPVKMTGTDHRERHFAAKRAAETNQNTTNQGMRT